MARSSTRIERAVALLVLLVSCGDSDPRSAPAASAAGPPVHVTISVDWEGAYLDPEALAAQEKFRADNPGVPISHFICPAYYTKPNAVTAEVAEILRRHVREGDEAGLHLHAWNSLITASGVTPRDARSFLSADGILAEFADDIGFDADPSIYTVEELRKILRRSRELLVAGGLTVSPIFRAAGWIGAPPVLEAARAEGITIDSSSTDPTWLGEGAGSSEDYAVLAARIRDIWPTVDRTTQPFPFETPAGTLLEMPDTGSMADHMSVEEMQQHVEWAAGSKARPIFVHLGFHAETAKQYAPLLSQALAGLRARKVPMIFVTVSDAGKVAAAPK